MWYPATVTVPAGSEPVSRDRAKVQLGITGTEHDDQVDGLIAAARTQVENYCGIKLVQQTVEAKCDSFCDFTRVAVAPIQSITSITYLDTAGEEQTLPTSVYELRKEGLAPAIVLKYGQVWPTIQLGSRITVTAVVGYATVPADIVLALLLQIGKTSSLSRPDLTKRSETVEGVGSTTWGGVVEVAGQVDRAVALMLENYRSWPL